MLELELVIKELKEELNAAIVEKDDTKEQAKNEKEELEEVWSSFNFSLLVTLILLSKDCIYSPFMSGCNLIYLEASVKATTMASRTSLNKQNSNSGACSTCLFHFFAVVARLRHEFL